MSEEESPITLEAFEGLVTYAFDLRAEIEGIEKQAKEKQRELSVIQSKILQLMADLNKTSYDASKGKIVVQKKFSVAQPRDPESKQKFFSYLKEKGVFEDLVNVHSQTLNAYYKEELAAAQDRGDFDFEIPGLPAPIYHEHIQMRKK